MLGFWFHVDPAQGENRQSIASGDLKIEGKKDVFTEFLGLLDTFPFWFNTVTP